MAQPGLSDLSNELFESIAEYLDLPDLCNLRCVSRGICYKTSQSRFQSYFRSKHVRLTPKDLEEFAWATSEGRFGQLLRELTLVGTAYNRDLLQRTLDTHNAPRGDARAARRGIANTLVCTKKGLVRIQKDLKLFDQKIEKWQSHLKQGILLDRLQTALSQIGGSTPCLDRLSLEIEVVHVMSDPPTTPREVWPPGSTARAHVLPVAAEMGALALAAIRQSKITVRTLDLFTSDPGSLCCSFPSDGIAKAFPNAAHESAPSLGSIRNLAICVSDPALCVTTKDLAEFQRVLNAEIERRSLVKLLGHCTNVEELSISRYQDDTYLRSRGAWDLRQSVRLQEFTQVAQSVALPSLRTLCLGGLTANIADLTAFITNHRSTLENIYLLNLEIEQGTLSPLLAILTLEHCPNLQSLTLEHIFEHHGNFWELVQFGQQQASELTKIDGDSGENLIVRSGADLRKPITYHTDWNRWNGQGKAWLAGRRRRELFGYMASEGIVYAG